MIKKGLKENLCSNNQDCPRKKRNFFIECIIILFLILFPTWGHAQGEINNDPNCGCIDIRISNITSNDAVISWISPFLTTAEVRYGTDSLSLTNIAFDNRGEDFVSSTHYHHLSNLDEKTQYFYHILQNNKVCSEGSFSTGPAIGFTGFSPTVYGQTFDPNGIPFKEGAIIYIRIQAADGVSSLLSTLTFQQGGWRVKLSPRTENLEYYFLFTNEDILLIEGFFGQPCLTGSLENPISQSLSPNFVQLQMQECPKEIHLSPGENIQEAINIAGYGDEIILAQGTYTGTINFRGKAITIRSEDPDAPKVVAATLINAGGSGTAVTFSSGEGSGSVLSGITIENGNGENGGGFYCNGASPVITKCHIENNTANKDGGGIYCLSASPLITECSISKNSASDGRGGGIFCDTDSSPVIQRCYITNNDGYLGGGISGFRVSASIKIINCIIADNEAHKGAGIFFEQDCSPKITNCTITNNKADKGEPGAGGGICLYAASSPIITNCILWGNTATEDNEIYLESSNPSIYYSDIKGGWTGNGSNNIDTDPLFFDSNAGNYRLMRTSPCINKGTSADAPYEDIIGGLRPQCDKYDIGAYEFKGDLDCDGWITASDLDDLIDYILIYGYFEPADLNSDGKTDVIDHYLLLLIAVKNKQPPIADNQSITTGEDTATNITLTASDTESAPLMRMVVTEPSHGTLSGEEPNLTYEPNADYNGTDCFTYKANDGFVDSNIATVSITITPVNDPPVAECQEHMLDEDITISIILTGHDVDLDILTYTIVTQPSHGELSGTPPNLTYSPDKHYNGTDCFTYKANDGFVDSNIAIASITVTPVNDPPVAECQEHTLDEDITISIILTGHDVDLDILTYTIVTQPSHGELSGTPPNLTYSPNKHYNGTDCFTFKANDGYVDSNIAIASITVTPVNDPPEANSQSLETDENTAISIILTGSDVDEDVLTYTIVTYPSHGTLSGTVPNVTYTPDANYSGIDNFSFKVNDGFVDSHTATVTIIIYPVDGSPVDCTIYEDAEDGTIDGWIIYDADPSDASVGNVFDTDRQSRVIELTSISREYCYLLQNEDESKWNNSNQFLVRWSMRYSKHFVVYFAVHTTDGDKYLYYTPVDFDALGNENYVHHGLGSWVTNGQWYSFERDLQADLEEAKSGVSILGVNSFMIYGSGRVDDIMLCNTLNPIGSISMNLPKGWSIFSVPVRFESKTVNDIFGDNARVVYGYDKAHGYIRVKTDEELKIGYGYWVCLFAAEEYTFTGEPIVTYERDEGTGWCIIGGLSKQGIVSIEKGSIGVIYGYKQGTGYVRVEADNIEPGKGYWMLIKDVTAESIKITVNGY